MYLSTVPDRKGGQYTFQRSALKCSLHVLHIWGTVEVESCVIDFSYVTLCLECHRYGVLIG